MKTSTMRGAWRRERRRDQWRGVTRHGGWYDSRWGVVAVPVPDAVLSSPRAPYAVIIDPTLSVGDREAVRATVRTVPNPKVVGLAVAGVCVLAVGLASAVTGWPTGGLFLALLACSPAMGVLAAAATAARNRFRHRDLPDRFTDRVVTGRDAAVTAAAARIGAAEYRYGSTSREFEAEWRAAWADLTAQRSRAVTGGIA